MTYGITLLNDNLSRIGYHANKQETNRTNKSTTSTRKTRTLNSQEKTQDFKRVRLESSSKW